MPKRVKEMMRLIKDFKASGAKPDATIGDWWEIRIRRGTDSSRIDSTGDLIHKSLPVAKPSRL